MLSSLPLAIPYLVTEMFLLLLCHLRFIDHHCPQLTRFGHHQDQFPIHLHHLPLHILEQILPHPQECDREFIFLLLQVLLLIHAQAPPDQLHPYPPSPHRTPQQAFRHLDQARLLPQ